MDELLKKELEVGQYYKELEERFPLHEVAQYWLRARTYAMEEAKKYNYGPSYLLDAIQMAVTRADELKGVLSDYNKYTIEYAKYPRKTFIRRWTTDDDGNTTSEEILLDDRPDYKIYEERLKTAYENIEKNLKASAAREQNKEALKKLK